jgi:hypothetical protein
MGLVANDGTVVCICLIAQEIGVHSSVPFAQHLPIVKVLFNPSDRPVGKDINDISPSHLQPGHNVHVLF